LVIAPAFLFTPQLEKGHSSKTIAMVSKTEGLVSPEKYFDTVPSKTYENVLLQNKMELVSLLSFMARKKI